MRVKIFYAIVLALIVAASSASAEPMLRSPGPDPIGQNLFPPDFVISQGGAIGLSDSQRNAIESAAINAQTQSMKLQFRIQESMSALSSLLAQPRVDESRVMTQLDQELDLERQMKHAQLGLMIQVKNTLTAEQQAKLQRLKPSPPGQ
jgi:Spy/CpxP family protein refolding chaperone